MITHPKRVWLKTEGGYFSREANEFDRDANRLIDKLLQPGGSLTPEERETLDIYNDSIQLEGQSLEKALKAKYGDYAAQLRAQAAPKKENAASRRSTRSNATNNTGFRGWMRRTFGV